MLKHRLTFIQIMRKSTLSLIFSILGLSHCFAQNIQFAFPLHNNTTNISPYPANCTGSVQDKDGNYYIIGNIVDTVDVDPGPNTFYLYQPEFINHLNIFNSLQAQFLIKYSKDGDLVWAQRFFSAYRSDELHIAIDKADNIYLTGTWANFLIINKGIDYDTIFTHQNTAQPEQSQFILKLDSDGNLLDRKRSYYGPIYARFNPCIMYHIEVDAEKSIYISGKIFGTHYLGDSTDENFRTTSQNENGSGFIAKYDSLLNIIWVKALYSRNGTDFGAINVKNSLKYILVTADFSDTIHLHVNGVDRSFIAKATPSEPLPFSSARNAIILKIRYDGIVLSAHQIFTPGIAGYASISEDSYKNIFFCASTYVFPNIMVNNILYNWTLFGEEQQLFIMSFDSLFNYRWHYISQGNGGNSSILDSQVDSAGNLIVSGRFSGGSRNFSRLGQPPIRMSAINFQNNVSLTDAFIAKYSKNGDLLRARKIGASGFDEINSMQLDKDNNLFITGYIQSNGGSFNFQNPALNQVSTNGPRNGFCGKYSQCITRTQVRDTICFGATKAFDGENLTRSGKYIRLRTYTPATQCEVWEELFLHVRPEIPASAGADASVCSGKSQQMGADSLGGLSYQWQQIGGTFTSTRARPSRSFTNFSDSTQRFRFALRVTDAKGCQKRDTVTLSIAPVLRDTLVQAICPGENFLGFDTAGTYIDTLVSSLGCDSIRTLTLSIKPVSTFSQNIRLCQNQSLQVGNRVYNRAGVYLDTLMAANGCDSLVTSTLSFDIPNDSIRAEANRGLVAVAGQDSYQWLDCNAGFAPIVGQTDSVFRPTRGGSYAVLVWKGSCADTSICLTVTQARHHTSNNIRIYPQPVSDKLFLLTQDNQPISELILFDAMGRKVMKEKGENIQEVSVSKLPEGLYQLKVWQGNRIEAFRVILKR